MGNFGKQLYMIRKKKNLTLRELDKLSGIKFVRIGRFENNTEKPTLENIRKLELALDVSFENIKEISDDIENLYVKFIDSLLYDVNDFDYYLKMIKDRDGEYAINCNYPIIMLILYIIDIHKRNFENIDKTERELEKLLEPKSDYLQSYYEYKGIKYHLQEQNKEASDILESAITLANNRKQNTMIYYHLCMVNISENKYIEALKYAELAKRGFVEFASFKRILYTDGLTGTIYSQMHRFDLAIEKYKACLHTCQFLEVPPSIKALILRNLSWFYIKDGDYFTPLSYLEEAEKLEPDSHHLKMYKIWCYYKQKKFNLARGLVHQYSDLRKAKTHRKRYKLFSELVYSAGKKPTITLIELAIDTYNEFAAKHDYELMNFYIDIVIDLLKQRNDDKTLIQYLELKIKINDEINK